MYEQLQVLQESTAAARAAQAAVFDRLIARAVASAEAPLREFCGAAAKAVDVRAARARLDLRIPCSE